MQKVERYDAYLKEYWELFRGVYALQVQTK